MNIGISGIGTSVGLGILKSIRSYSSSIKVIAIDNRFSAHSHMADNFFHLPKVENLQSYCQILDILNKNEIDVLLIASEYELEWFSNNKVHLESNTKTKICIASPKWIELGNNKLLTYRFIHSASLPVAPFYFFDTKKNTWLSGLTKDNLTQKDFPIFFKPVSGTSNKGIICFQEYSDLNKYLNQNNDDLTSKVLQKSLTSSDQFFEVTSSIVIGSKSAIPFKPFHAKRVLNKGISWRIERYSSEWLDNYVFKLAEQMPDYYGSLNIQFIGSETEGFLPLEINTRFSGTTSFRLACNRNEVMYLVNDLMNIDNQHLIDNAKKYLQPVMHRYVEDYIIDT
tara:strand:- start:521 stop:1537 length:1017 start_codon:yes stop_codon:yes gene_type:complete